MNLKFNKHKENIEFGHVLKTNEPFDYTRLHAGKQKGRLNLEFNCNINQNYIRKKNKSGKMKQVLTVSPFSSPAVKMFGMVS